MRLYSAYYELIEVYYVYVIKVWNSKSDHLKGELKIYQNERKTTWKFRFETINWVKTFWYVSVKISNSKVLYLKFKLVIFETLVGPL